MRAVVQRVSEASVSVGGVVVGEIGPGLVVLIAATHDDGGEDATILADKIAGLRIFRDAEAKMNRSVVDVAGAVLVVSQFTLYADTRKGRRPSFVAAADPTVAEPLIEEFAEILLARGITVESGRFGAAMEVRLVNDGPVTIILESRSGRIV